MPFFDIMVGTFDKAVGTAVMSAEGVPQRMRRERIAKNLEELSLASKITCVGSVALAAFAALLLSASGAGFIFAGALVFGAAICSAVLSSDIAEVSEKGSRMLTDGGAYGKALRSNKSDLVNELFNDTLLLKKLLPAKIKSDLAHDLI